MGFDQNLMKGSMAPIMLKILSGREMYGYEIIKLVHESTGGRFQWKEGSLYPCLHRLEAAGFLKSRWCEAPNGKARKYYRVTRRGRAELAKRSVEWGEFVDAVNSVLLVQRV